MTARVQQRRTRGWRKPEGAVCVSRPSRWGNPFTVAEHGRAEAVRLFEEALCAGALAVTVADVRQELAGRVLACFCPLDQACHADVLLQVANDTTTTGGVR